MIPSFNIGSAIAQGLAGYYKTIQNMKAQAKQGEVDPGTAATLDSVRTSLLSVIGMEFQSPTQVMHITTGYETPSAVKRAYEQKSPVDRLLDECDLPEEFTEEDLQELREFMELRM